MGGRYRSSDPTADAAIARVDRARFLAPRQPARLLTQEFPDLYASLLPHEARKLSTVALGLAGNDIWAVTRDHIVGALRQLARDIGEAPAETV